MARRIRIYLFGVVLGSIFVYFSLVKDRSNVLTSWLPAERILEEIKNNDKKSFSARFLCELKECSGLDSLEMMRALMKGDVLFTHDLSKPKAKPAIYVVDLQIENDLMVVLSMDSTEVIFDKFINDQSQYSCGCHN